VVEAVDNEDAAGPRADTVTDPIRVLLVDVSDRGGIARYTDCLRRALETEGAAVSLAAPGPRADKGLTLARHRWGPDVSGLARLRLRGRRLAEIAPSALHLGGAVVRSRCDVVHMQTEVVPPIDDLAVRAIGRRTPVVITAHDPEPLEGGKRALARQARRWRAADAVIIHGEGARRLVERCAPGVPVHVVPVDLALGGPVVSRVEARRRLGLDGAPTALLLGLLRPYKGIDLLADAWPMVRARVPGARLLLVGEPYSGADLDRLGRSEGVETRPGFIPEEEFDGWAAVPDVLVLPYRYGTHSGILHRAVTAGTPVLASPTLADEVHRTGAGRVVPLDAAAWADALVTALTGDPPPPPPPPTGHMTALGTLAVYRDVLTGRVRRSAPRRRSAVSATPIGPR
jgi:glycosyltransferase involved in cell wall biosynthesis